MYDYEILCVTGICAVVSVKFRKYADEKIPSIKWCPRSPA